MSRDIKIYIKTCETCQRREETRFEEPLFSTASSGLWSKVGLDIVHMPSCDLWDAEHVMQPTVIEVGHFVLMHDTQREKDVSSNRKLKYRWLSLYKIVKAIHKKGTYILQELDNTRLRDIFANNRLKPFYPRFELEADKRAAISNI
jgi:hypothetical protein